MNPIGICYLSHIAVREQPSHKAQMVTQLIFGEDYWIKETNDTRDCDWCFIQCCHDNYEGWIPQGQVYYLSDSLDSKCFDENKAVVKHHFALSTPQSRIIRLSPGSKLPFFDLDKRLFRCQKDWVKPIEEKIIVQMATEKANYCSQQTILQAIMEFCGTPYLWGGRTIWGIDCSGLIQVAFRLAGIALPRDAYQQADSDLGKTCHLLDAQPCDVAFFSSEPNNNRITHVGILLSAQTILHASNYVQIDMMDKTGIYKPKNSNKKDYSHYLKSIKRFL